MRKSIYLGCNDFASHRLSILVIFQEVRYFEKSALSPLILQKASQLLFQVAMYIPGLENDNSNSKFDVYWTVHHLDN